VASFGLDGQGWIPGRGGNFSTLTLMVIPWKRNYFFGSKVAKVQEIKLITHLHLQLRIGVPGD
jgi:hypothetical protein